MTDTPSDAAIEEALRRMNCGLSVATIRERAQHYDWHAQSVLAHAKTLQEVDRTLRGAEDMITWTAPNGPVRALIRSLMLPQPDPDEELARAFHDAYETLASGFDYSTREDTRQFDPRSPNGKLMLATIKRLREQGRLTDAK